MTPPEPVLLLADSQLLFARSAAESSVLEGVAARLSELGIERPRAAYFGAANGDAPEFFELFTAAMGSVEVHDARHIPATPTASDLDYAASAEILLFAGGDVARGWKSFEAHGLPDLVRQRYYQGAHLIGVSAGAVHLGLGISRDTNRSNGSIALFELGESGGSNESGESKESGALTCGFAVVPFVVDAHAEPEWAALERAVAHAGPLTRGLGIPTGGGVRYHSDYSLEPLRHAAVEITIRENGPLERSLLVPAS